MNTTEVRAPAIHSEEFVVPGGAIDGNGHVNNVAFVQWMQDVATRHFGLGGCMEAMRAAGGTWVARSHHIEYLRPAFAGERLQVLTWVADFGRVRSLRRYRFRNAADGKLLVRGETDWVFINARTGRPASVPEEIRKAFMLVAADQDVKERILGVRPRLKSLSPCGGARASSRPAKSSPKVHHS